MANLIHSAEISGEIARVTPAHRIQDQAALAVIEQMYGYFSFEPMPLEAMELPKAA